MKLKDLFSRIPVGAGYVLGVGALAFSTVGLTVLLWFVASGDPPVVRVEGTDAPRVVRPGVVPDVLARDFAIDYLVSFETYSPETVERAVAFSRSRVAPHVLPGFNKLLDNRLELVRESGLVSQILIEDRAAAKVLRSDTDPKLQVVVTGLRRIYIAGKLTESARVVYRLGLEAGQPTRDNPTGLYVTGQSVNVAPRKGSSRDG